MGPWYFVIYCNEPFCWCESWIFKFLLLIPNGVSLFLGNNSVGCKTGGRKSSLDVADEVIYLSKPKPCDKTARVQRSAHCWTEGLPVSLSLCFAYWHIWFLGLLFWKNTLLFIVYAVIKSLEIGNLCQFCALYFLPWRPFLWSSLVVVTRFVALCNCHRVLYIAGNVWQNCVNRRRSWKNVSWNSTEDMILLRTSKYLCSASILFKC